MTTPASGMRGPIAAIPLHDGADPSSDSKVPGADDGSLTIDRTALLSGSTSPLGPSTAPLYSMRSRSPRGRALLNAINAGVKSLGLTESSRRAHALNQVAALEAEALKAVRSGAPDAGSLVEKAVQAMFEHSKTFRSDELRTQVDHAHFKEEAHWLEKCISLYSSLNPELPRCGLVDQKNSYMRPITERGSEIYDSSFWVGTGQARRVDPELYLRSLLWASYKFDSISGVEESSLRALMNSAVDANARNVYLPDAGWIRGASETTIQKVLAAQDEVFSGLDPDTKGMCIAQLEEHLANGEATALAIVFARGLPDAGGAPLVPQGRQPVLDGYGAKYNAEGELEERNVATPKVIMDLIAGYADVKKIE